MHRDHPASLGELAHHAPRPPHARRGAGHDRFADEISVRFRALCEAHGFAENFDALTGTGLRDRAYTWTAASYLFLAEAHTPRQPLTS